MKALQGLWTSTNIPGETQTNVKVHNFNASMQILDRSEAALFWKTLTESVYEAW